MQHGKEIAAQVLKEGWDFFSFKTMAHYTAEFYEKGEPVFLGVKSFVRGLDLRYVVMHHFFERVGKNKSFVTMQLLDDEPALFERFVRHGVLAEGKDTKDSFYVLRFKVLKDPRKSLEEYIRLPNKPGPFYVNVMGIDPKVT